jgi:hypothetical protein
LLGAAAFGGAIPSLPGGVGTLDGAMAGAVTLLSGNQSAALAVALVNRVLTYLYSAVFGLYGLSMEGQTISGVYQQLIKFQSHSAETARDVDSTQE